MHKISTSSWKESNPQITNINEFNYKHLLIRCTFRTVCMRIKWIEYNRKNMIPEIYSVACRLGALSIYITRCSATPSNFYAQIVKWQSASAAHWERTIPSGMLINLNMANAWGQVRRWNWILGYLIWNLIHDSSSDSLIARSIVFSVERKLSISKMYIDRIIPHQTNCEQLMKLIDIFDIKWNFFYYP